MPSSNKVILILKSAINYATPLFNLVLLVCDECAIILYVCLFSAAKMHAHTLLRRAGE
jgi:hypothetical protein